ncbi:hypothetical protein BO71DRAFT_48166 [Aspergillus ellipticus CBS 707.79]|uniref:Uncharacterized protein n=1 Tax=Aspergillus ellipticus CBS 707.79 TaxID=1448320 RepID=A0A319DAV2_9EURO|nr:hypothetical protein BO71DRAFT_48166 [Aspergillus ellipticus CBS 707.79]
MWSVETAVARSRRELLPDVGTCGILIEGRQSDRQVELGLQRLARLSGPNGSAFGWRAIHLGSRLAPACAPPFIAPGPTSLPRARTMGAGIPPHPARPGIRNSEGRDRSSPATTLLQRLILDCVMHNLANSLASTVAMKKCRITTVPAVHAAPLDRSRTGCWVCWRHAIL